MSTRAAERELNLKRKKADRRKQKRAVKLPMISAAHISSPSARSASDHEDDYEIEYVPEPISADYESLLTRFAPLRADEYDSSFQGTEYSTAMADILDEDAQRKAAEAAASAILADTAKLSNKEKKLTDRISLAALKAVVDRPDLVDGMDNCSSDPQLLLLLKGYKNAVQVPRHWSNKRNYLANKRGIDKGVFKLPDFIEQTGIAKIRQAIIAKEAEKDIKAKQRAKMRPKTGKLDIDYQVLYKAFFKYQTKPSFLTKFGDIYYEGREAETKYVHKRPGQVSPLLREALGMMDGCYPVPWLVNMQRFGPPPSYPYLKIPGLNSPIPVGAEWGYHPGGWGKPPVDEYGTPIYGGIWRPETDRAAIVDLGNLQARKDLWGEFADDSSEDEDEEVSDVIPVAAPPAPVAPQPQFSQGVAVSLAPPSIPTVPQPSPASLDLYRVLPQKSAPSQPGALFPSKNVYDVSPEHEIATAAGIAQRSHEVENDNIITAEMIKKQLAEHEAAAAKLGVEPKKPKKKQKFKF